MNFEFTGTIVRMTRDWIIEFLAMISYYALLAYDIVLDTLTAIVTETSDYIVAVFNLYGIKFLRIARNYSFNVLQDIFLRLANKMASLTISVEAEIQNKYLHENITDPAEVSNTDHKPLTPTLHKEEYWAFGFLMVLFILYYHVLPRISLRFLWHSFKHAILVKIYGEGYDDIPIPEPAFGTPRIIPNEIFTNGLQRHHLNFVCINTQPFRNCHTHHHLMNKPSGGAHVRLIPTQLEAQNHFLPGNPTVAFAGYDQATVNAIEGVLINALNTGLTKEASLINVTRAVRDEMRNPRQRRGLPMAGVTAAVGCVCNSSWNELHVALDNALAQRGHKLRNLLPLAQDLHLPIVHANYNAYAGRKKRLRSYFAQAVINLHMPAFPN